MNNGMRHLKYLLIFIIAISTSCAGLNKRLHKNESPSPDTPIKEVEEKLVPIEEVLPSPEDYFVIIGSFRNPDNAKKHQADVLMDGFKSEILKNESGLYRVSVKATNEIDVARKEIRNIWSKFPQYSDTWLLIQKR